jgi:hypothetical protein
VNLADNRGPDRRRCGPHPERISSCYIKALRSSELGSRFGAYSQPKGFHRIRHYGLFANASRAENIAKARAILNVAPPAAAPQEQPDIATDTPRVLPCPCPRCGARMIVIEVFARGCEPRWRPMPGRIDTS